MLGLRFCARASFSSCDKWGPLFIAVRGPLTIAAFFLLQSTGSRRAGSVVVAHRPSCFAACGIFPDQGSNPCPLHWQADSQPLRHCLYFVPTYILLETLTISSFLSLKSLVASTAFSTVDQFLLLETLYSLELYIPLDILFPDYLSGCPSYRLQD